jgi:hypothetical protein
MSVKSVKIGDMLVYPVTNNLVDVFWGNGFDNQARFKFNKDSIDRVPNKNVDGSTVRLLPTLPRGIYQVLKQFKGEK